MRAIDSDNIEPGAVVVSSIAVLILWLGGCASGKLAPESCSSDEECGQGARCVADVCQMPEDTALPPGADGGDTGIGPIDSGGDDDPRDSGAPGGDDTSDTGSPGDRDTETGGSDTRPPEDTRPPGCNDRCGLGETCESGQCVTKCSPKCTSEQQCLDIGDGPQCYAKCNEAQSTKGCRGSGVLCRDLNPKENKELLLCVPSQCDTQSDCQAGSCIHYINDFGACVSTGPRQIGQPCDRASRSELCERGAICVPDGSGGTTGICRELCDPWNPQCDSGGYCSLLFETPDGLSFLTRRQGYCNLQTDAQGSAPFQQCRRSGNMCSHAVRCVGVGSPSCLKWCRPGEGDCRGTVPSQWRTTGKCHNYTFPGVRKVGRCVPRCNGSTVTCPDGMQCKNGLCRQTCTPSTVARDCCGGNTPCAFKCPNGFCE